MDSIDLVENLINGAIQHQVLQNRNPYFTKETMVVHLLNKICDYTRVQYQPISDKTVLFSEWHEEILDAYESMKPKMSHEEKMSVERVLSKEYPNSNELTKFACAWYKYDPCTACRWFAVDGLLGTHPKLYVQEAFSKNLEKHNSAVRDLYSFYSDPDMIKQIVCKALEMDLEETYISNPDVERCVGLYAEMVGEEEMKCVATDRRNKLQAQQQPNKRKKKARTKSPVPVSPVPVSPAHSPQHP